MADIHSFQEEELGEIIAKNMARTVRGQLEGRRLLFGECLRSWTDPKRALSKMNFNIDESMEVSMFYVFKLGIILNEELWRSRRVLSASAYGLDR